MILKCGDSNFKYGWLDLIAQDPVHPGINVYNRIINDRTVFVYAIDNEAHFIISAQLTSKISKTMDEIMKSECDTSIIPTIAIFYSIFRIPGKGIKGTGGQVLKDLIDYCKLRGIKEFYTLSPIPFLTKNIKELPDNKTLYKYLESRTGPVENFHLKNEAQIKNINYNADSSEIRMNESWGIMINYNYTLDE